MFSSTEYPYVKDLLLNYYNNDYTHYICMTNNPIDYGSTNNTYDIYCYLSKDNITYNDNHFVIKQALKLSIDSNTYSTNNTIDKLVLENVGNITLLEDTKEYVYSDVVGYPDLLAEYRTSINNHLDVNFLYTIPILLSLIFLITFLKSIFKNRR